MNNSRLVHRRLRYNRPKNVQNASTSNVESRLQIVAKHPLFLLVVGFLLTSVLGNSITRSLNNASESRQNNEAIKKQRLESIEEISRLIYARQSRASLLASSIQRGAPDQEISERKKLYDEAYHEWNSTIQAVQLKIREITDEKDYSTIESYIQYGLVKRFGELDNHLTACYDARILKTEGCNAMPFKSEIQACIECGYVITNFLWIKTSNAQDPQLMKRAFEELQRRCPKNI